MLALVVLGGFDLLKFDFSFDTLAYHLPFAGLRVGMISEDEFVLRPDLQQRLLGFPALIDIVQGGLWRAFGTPAAASLIAPAAIACFAIYARLAFGLGMLWSAAIFLAIPVLHTAVDSAYVDLWTNVFFAIHLLAAYRALGNGTRNRVLHAVISNLALFVAVNSKPQFYVVGALSYALFIVLLGTRWLRRNAADESISAARSALLLSLVLLPLAFYSPLKNALSYRNPVYPIKVVAFGIELPGPATFDDPALPASLARIPQVVRYALSQLELQALSNRPGGYTNGQGVQPDGADGSRIGGSLCALLIASLGVLVLALRRSPPRPAQTTIIIAFGAIVIAVASMPGSYELRYFSFVNIMLTFAALTVLEAGADRGDQYIAGLSSAFRALLIGSCIFVGFVTGWDHLRPQPLAVQDVVVWSGARNELLDALQRSDTVCYTRPDMHAFLFAPKLNRSAVNRPYRVVAEFSRSECPPGSAIID